MSNDLNDPLRAPDCMQEETRLIEGRCAMCGTELEFFSVSELRQSKYCPNCKQPLDTKTIAIKAGVSI